MNDNVTQEQSQQTPGEHPGRRGELLRLPGGIFRFADVCDP